MTPQTFGRYEIKSELGRGGMATVFHAYDPRFQRDVALKVLPREFLHDPTFRARFEREAQTIAALEHAGIVPVYDFGEDHGQPYLVMRFLPGGTLTQRLASGALPFAEAGRIVNRLAPALDEAHAQGIVHRDLKPDNILFDQRHDPFITDFGIVKLSQGGQTLTTDSVIVGTPAYMSPEQARGDSVVDGRSDIYALGVILFQMLSGKLPFHATTPVGMVMKHIIEPAPHILTINPTLPPICDSIILRAMAKEPDERFARATDLAAALSGSPVQSPSSKAPGGVPVPIPVGAAVRTPLNKNISDQDISDQRPASGSPSLQPVGPSPAGPFKELTCPNCTAPLPRHIVPNQPVECSSCGSRFMMTLPKVDETIICPGCHTVNQSSLRHCATCGERLQIDCVRCHTINRIDATHCANCGTNLQSAEQRRREIQENRRQAQQERDQMLKEKKARQQTEKIQRLIDDLADPGKHEFAIYQLNQIGDPAIPALVEALLNDSNRNARYGAAKTLGEICSQYEIKTLSKARAGKALIKALDDAEVSVRYYSVEALVKLPAKQAQLAVDPLGVLLKDPDERIRKKARAALEKIGGPRAQEILDSSKGLFGWLKG